MGMSKSNSFAPRNEAVKWHPICLSVLIYTVGTFFREIPQNYQGNLQFLQQTEELLRKQAHSDQLIYAQNLLGNINPCFDRT